MKLPLAVLFVVILAVAAFFIWQFQGQKSLQSPSITQSIKEKVKPLEKYTYENLQNTQFAPGKITLGEILEETESYTSQVFFIELDPEVKSGKTKKVSGLASFPKEPGTYPVIVQYRGFIPPEVYTTGAGTIRTGQTFAQNGFITLAPDFLSFGQSDDGVENSIEDRFQTYVTAITVLESIDSLNQQFLSQNNLILADENKIGIWGHSNGGQIALTVLEITGNNYPTVLWAPVSKPFPYSILYYTDEFDDHGKALRKVIANFEEDYDVENYSLSNYLENINAPIQIYQGGADTAVPQDWSDDLNTALLDLEKDVEYFVYPGDDHNFALGSWNSVVAANIAFFKELLE